MSRSHSGDRTAQSSGHSRRDAARRFGGEPELCGQADAVCGENVFGKTGQAGGRPDAGELVPYGDAMMCRMAPCETRHSGPPPPILLAPEEFGKWRGLGFVK